jgi:hypothetical protein
MRAQKLSPERRAEIASLGGQASADAMTSEARIARAKKAIAARWAKKAK